MAIISTHTQTRTKQNQKKQNPKDWGQLDQVACDSIGVYFLVEAFDEIEFVQSWNAIESTTFNMVDWSEFEIHCCCCVGLTIFYEIFSIFTLNDGIFCRTSSIPYNVVMDMIKLWWVCETADDSIEPLSRERGLWALLKPWTLSTIGLNQELVSST